MNGAAHRKPFWPLACATAIWLGIAFAPASARSQRKAPPKPSSSAEKEDPLAPLLQQANDSIEKANFAAALDPLQKYIAQRPEDPYAHFQLGYSYAGLKRSDDARIEFSRAVALDPKMAAAYLNLGLVLMDSDPTAAAEAFRHTVELQPTESRPRFLAAYSLERAGKLPEAAEQYRAALAISPKDYEARFALGRVLLRTNDAAGAEDQFREAVTARGDSAPARLGLANALQAQKKFQEASDTLDGYLKLNPGDRAAHFDRASDLLSLDLYDDALSELDRAATDSTPTAEIFRMRCDIYVRQKKWDEAGKTLTQALGLYPHDAELATWLGHVDIELHQYPAAISILGQVYKQNPQSVDALRDLTNAYFLNEDYSSTIAAMDQLAKIESPKPGSWFVRAISYDRLSHKAEAIDAYQKFLDQDNGQHDKEDFQARHRILTLQGELGQSGKKQKK